MGVKALTAACVAALAMACAWAGDASATIYTLTLEGTVYASPDTIDGRVWTGTDGDGLFGTAGANLSGDSYTAVFTADSTLGKSFASDYLFRAGGTAYGASSPIVSATLTINGHTTTFSPGWSDEVFYESSYRAGDPQDLLVEAVGAVWGQNGFSGEGINVGTIGQNLFTSAGGGTSLLLSDGTATITPDDIPSTVLPTIGGDGPAVPEPSTWTMLILGFGLLGTLLRRVRGTELPSEL